MKLTLHLLTILKTLICINQFLLAFQSLPTTAMHLSNETHRFAMLALKDQIVGDPLGVLTSWNKRSKLGDVYSYGILLLEMISGKRPTDSMFKDDFTIHQFAKTTLPERLVDILEPSSLQVIQDAENSRARSRERRVGALESLMAVARIGVLCSMESSSERMEMKEVTAELCAIREKFLGNRI